MTLLLGTVFSVHSQENTAILCADGIDNDGNGLIDCEDEQCLNLTWGTIGCEICSDGISFADVLLGSSSGFLESTGPLGVNDWPSANSGVNNLYPGGYIIVGFTNNTLTNSGTSDEDLIVFEIDNNPEFTIISLRPVDENTISLITAAGIEDTDNDTFYEFGLVMGGVSGIDIDAYVPGTAPNTLLFDAAKILDANVFSTGPDGAEIDAVCAVSYVEIPDCAGNFPATFAIDGCGECLALNDPLFNQSCPDCAGLPNGPFIIDDCGNCNNPISDQFNLSCTDCMGVVNGTAVYDECGICLLIDDPSFNQSCFDCNGVVDGPALIDPCGECISVNDPAFGQSCADCAGTAFGTAILDECGLCLEADDPNFNQACTDCAGIINGTSVIDGCGVCIEIDSPDFNQSCTDCQGFLNGPLVLDSCGVCLSPNSPDFNQSCLDCAGIPLGESIIDSCGFCLLPSDPNLNKSCLIQVFIPNAFSPDFDGINDHFEVYKENTSELFVKHYAIYDRWGNQIYLAENFNFSERENWWDGSVKQGIVDSGVYIYVIEITATQTLSTELFGGEISVVK